MAKAGRPFLRLIAAQCGAAAKAMAGRARVELQRGLRRLLRPFAAYCLRFIAAYCLRFIAAYCFLLRLIAAGFGLHPARKTASGKRFPKRFPRSGRQALIAAYCGLLRLIAAYCGAAAFSSKRRSAKAGRPSLRLTAAYCDLLRRRRVLRLIAAQRLRRFAVLEAARPVSASSFLWKAKHPHPDEEDEGFVIPIPTKRRRLARAHAKRMGKGPKG